jgi:hypothetical protein
MATSAGVILLVGRVLFAVFFANAAYGHLKNHAMMVGAALALFALLASIDHGLRFAGQGEESDMTDPWLEELSYEECLVLLRSHTVGRLAVVADDIPVVLPINYRLVETMGRTWVAVRTRPGDVLDQAPAAAAFEIDDIEVVEHGGQSVLVRGQLNRIDETVPTIRELFDSEPWITHDRDAWLIIEPFTITGRRLNPASHEWACHPRAYL